MGSLPRPKVYFISLKLNALKVYMKFLVLTSNILKFRFENKLIFNTPNYSQICKHDILKKLSIKNHIFWVVFYKLLIKFYSKVCRLFSKKMFLLHLG